MTPDDPRHGTYAGWQLHMRERMQGSTAPICDPCRAASTRYTKRHRLMRRRGLRSLVPLGDRAARILAAHSPTSLAQATGIRRDYISRLRAGGPGAQVNHRTRAKILDAGRNLPTLLGIQRRVRALYAAGHPFAAQERVLGIVRAESLAAIAHQPGPPAQVKSEVRDAILKTYDALAMQQPRSSRATTRARRHAAELGWWTAMAWDDIDHDPTPPDPTETRRRKTDLDPIVVERVLTGDQLPMTTAERLEVVRRLRDDRGWSEERIRDHTGIAKASDTARFPRRDKENAA